MSWNMEDGRVFYFQLLFGHYWKIKEMTLEGNLFLTGFFVISG